MPADRWARIQAAVITPEVEDAMRKQAIGERLTEEERKILAEADYYIDKSIRGWETGDPNDVFAQPTATPVPTGTPEPVGTPQPGDPNFPTGVPDLSPPPEPGDTVYGPPLPQARSINGPYQSDDILTVEDMFGNQLIMTPDQFYNEDPSYRGTVIAVEPAGTRDTTIPRPAPPPEAAPVPTPTTPASPPGTPPAVASAPPAPVAAPPSRPAAPPTHPAAPPTAARPPGAPPIKEPPSRNAPGNARPAPAPVVPDIGPPTPPPPPPPFEQDTGGALLPSGRFPRAIEQAGGRPTQRVAERVGREIGEVFRPGEQGGYRGDTGGWRTLAHQSANAWEEQYRADPTSLRPSERQAYEKDPNTLHRTILNADSPFRDYRESWIGATRAGQIVPTSSEFSGDLRPFGAAPPSFGAGTGISDVTDRGGVPRETTPGARTAEARVIPAEEAPVAGNLDLSEFGGVPELGLTDMSEFGGVTESELRTPSSNTLQGAPLPEPDLMTAPEVEQVVPYADQPVDETGEPIPEEESAAVVIMATPDLSLPEAPEEAPPEQTYEPEQQAEEEVSYSYEDDDDDEVAYYEDDDDDEEGDVVAEYDDSGDYVDEGEYY